MLKRIRDNFVFETLFFAGYFFLKKVTCKDARSNWKKQSFNNAYKRPKTDAKPLSDYNIAIICDELTYENFSRECHLHILTPNNWKQIFQEQDIDLFFCESTWHGCKANKRCWRGRVYKNHNVLFETRRTIFQILKHCRENNIPTVFWNKEDPTYFENPKYDFVDTALHFQYIFTTAEECIEKYQKKGHAYVNLMMFGFSPDIYNPQQNAKKQKRAIFAGSWFGKDTQRCKAEEVLFQKILSEKIPLTIYNRQSDSKKKDEQFPQIFQQYVKPAISQKQLGKEIKHSQYAINVNTVTDSETMFARRVYELMASNVYIISNPSKAMQKQLKGRYSDTEEDLPAEINAICRDNVNYVFANHTNQIRLQTMLSQIGLMVDVKEMSIAIYCKAPMNESYLSTEGLHCEYVKDLQMITERYQYFMIWDGITAVAIQQMLPHYRYLDILCGIRIESCNLYQIVEDNVNINVLFPLELLGQLKLDLNAKLKKYHI